MFDKILIANRGEIAVRVIRACRDMGIISVAVFSEADRQALHTQIADEAICIGPAPARDSYLNMQSILSAAMACGAEAIHPGYGFLSENADFAGMCVKCGIIFIGPEAETIAMLGDKANARATAAAAGVPVTPGSDGIVADINEARETAKRIGYPLMLKASSGGGGRGIRVVNGDLELERALNIAMGEAEACFGSRDVYIEKYIKNPRHIEFQILADSYGDVVHLFERDCSIQRRHQKIIEETPSPFMDDKLRAKMGGSAINIAKATGYRNAGTVEFLVDADRNYYFMEMNTRIQVEHPVTEQVTGLDLVKKQIEIAAGQRLGLKQENIILKGHAMECRINAEDPQRDFAPCPGTINGLNVPGGPGVRVDNAVYQGYTVPPFYDSMIAKLITYSHDRATTIARMRRALSEFLFDGVTTTVDFLLGILDDPDFVSGDYTTAFLESRGKPTERSE